MIALIFRFNWNKIYQSSDSFSGLTDEGFDQGRYTFRHGGEIYKITESVYNKNPQFYDNTFKKVEPEKWQNCEFYKMSPVKLSRIDQIPFETIGSFP